MLADAHLRQGRGDLAFDGLAAARDRWPEDQGLQRRFAVAALMSGRETEGLLALDELLDKHAEDEPSLALGMLAPLRSAWQQPADRERRGQDRVRMQQVRRRVSRPRRAVARADRNLGRGSTGK